MGSNIYEPAALDPMETHENESVVKSHKESQLKSDFYENGRHLSGWR